MHTGVVAVDEQHIKIAEYVNRLDDVMFRKCDRKTIQKAIDEIVAYMIYHFSYEESIQEKANYPFLKAHKRVHEFFARRLSDYQERFKAGEDVADELYIITTDWLIKHVEYDDMDFIASVKGINIAQNKNYPSGWKTGVIQQALRLVTPSKLKQETPSRLIRDIADR